VTPVFRVRDATLVANGHAVLSHLDLDVRSSSVVVILGKAGSGKSTVLRLLSGRPPGAGIAVTGQWQHEGHDIEPGGDPLRGVAWVPQIKHAPAGVFRDRHRRQWATHRLEAAFAAAPVVLLDEPTRGLDDVEIDGLVDRIRAHAERGAAVVVTHHMGFAERVADELCVLVEGRVAAAGGARGLFGDPPAGPVRDLLRTGSYSLPPFEPALPTHFRWHVPQRLAGMGRPGLFRELDEDLSSIAHAGITALVSLTHDPIPTARLRPFGINGRHFPIKDMGVPALGEASALCRFVTQAIASGERVAFHCHAGLGRTGTMVAGVLVASGEEGERAVARVRSVAPGSIQTSTQEQFVMRLAQEVAW
jgi:atypical dual specificity phosphatase